MPRQQCIIYKTLELIDEVGLENISMRKIADKCEIPLSSLYSHYKSKAELLNAIFEYSLAKSFHTFNIIDLEDELTPETYLTSVITSANENKLYFRFITQYKKSGFVSEGTQKENKKCFMKQQIEITEMLNPYLRDSVDMKMFGFIVHGVLTEVVRRDEVPSEMITSLVDIMLNGITKEKEC